MFKSIITPALALILAAGIATAQEDAIAPLDDTAGMAAEGVTMDPDDADMDAENGPDGAEFLLLGKSPLAYGTVNSSGSKNKGSSNWSSSYNGTYKRYEITITNQNYYYLNYATVITPAGDARFCRSSSVGGKLLVYCYDHAGNAKSSRFGFLTFSM